MPSAPMMVQKMTFTNVGKVEIEMGNANTPARRPRAPRDDFSRRGAPNNRNEYNAAHTVHGDEVETIDSDTDSEDSEEEQDHFNDQGEVYASASDRRVTRRAGLLKNDSPDHPDAPFTGLKQRSDRIAQIQAAAAAHALHGANNGAASTPSRPVPPRSSTGPPRSQTTRPNVAGASGIDTSAHLEANLTSVQPTQSVDPNGYQNVLTAATNINPAIVRPPNWIRRGLNRIRRHTDPPVHTQAEAATSPRSRVLGRTVGTIGMVTHLADFADDIGGLANL